MEGFSGWRNHKPAIIALLILLFSLRFVPRVYATHDDFRIVVVWVVIDFAVVTWAVIDEVMKKKRS